VLASADGNGAARSRASGGWLSQAAVQFSMNVCVRIARAGDQGRRSRGLPVKIAPQAFAPSANTPNGRGIAANGQRIPVYHSLVRFRQRKVQHPYTLAFTQVLKPDLAAVGKSHCIAIAIHRGVDLRESYFLL